jgi:hypothetical protein
VSGAAAALAASPYVTGATNVTVDGAATLDQLAAIDAATTGTMIATLTNEQVTDANVALFDTSNELTLNAEIGATLGNLSFATLNDAKVRRLDAYDNQVTLTNEKVTSAIVEKFVDADEDPDVLTLNAPGAVFKDLGTDTMYHPGMILDSNSGPVELTAAQFEVLSLDSSTTTIAPTDNITIISSPFANALNLHSAGGAGATLVFNELNDAAAADVISGFDVLTDKLQFLSTVFAANNVDGTLNPAQFLSANDVTGTGTEGSTDTRFLYNNGNGANAGDLFYDADGSGAGEAVQIANMQTVPGLTADDIIMIA